MGTKGKHFLALLGTVAALGWAAAALADSGLSMPFACHVEGGRVALTPSAPRTYRVYGTSESRMFSTCAPNMPGGCPSLKLQRFNLDCSRRRGRGRQLRIEYSGDTVGALRGKRGRRIEETEITRMGDVN